MSTLARAVAARLGIAPSPRSASPGQRRRRIALAVLTLVALLGHVSLLGGLGSGDHGSATAPTASLDVRTIAGQAAVADVAEAVPEVAPAEMPVVEAPVVRRRAPAVREATSTRLAPPESAASAAANDAASAPAPAPDRVVTEATSIMASAASAPRLEDASSSSSAASGVASAVVAAASGVAPASAEGTSVTANPLADTGAASAPASLAASTSGDLVVRTYRTQVPPAMTFTYEVRRGFLRGNGEVRWRPGADGYSLVLEAKLAGITLLTQTSDGGFDGAGLAPMRFVDQRVRRAAVAANFQREAAKVTFSGNAVELALPPGTQDRISWMVQIAAILSAEPELATPGGSVAMYVIGARGDGAVWVLRFVGDEFVDTVDGSLRAAHFTRDARGPYDTTVDVWVDPARHYFPVRAKQRSGNDEFDLLLESMTPG